MTKYVKIRIVLACFHPIFITYFLKPALFYIPASPSPTIPYKILNNNATPGTSAWAEARANQDPAEDLDVLVWKLALTIAVCLALFIGSLVVLVTIAYSRRKAWLRSHSGTHSGGLTYQNPTDVLLDESEAFQDIDTNGNNSGSVITSTAESRTPIYLPGVHSLGPIAEEPPFAIPRPQPSQKLNRAPFNSQNYQTNSAEEKGIKTFVTLEV